MASQHLFDAIDDHLDDSPGEYALSVAAWPGYDVDEIALHPDADFLIQGKVRVATAKTLRERGYNAVEDDLPHALILLPGPPTEETWEELRALFSDVRPNPRPRPAR